LREAIINGCGFKFMVLAKTGAGKTASRFVAIDINVNV
jgi:hypothetical protein